MNNSYTISKFKRSDIFSYLGERRIDETRERNVAGLDQSEARERFKFEET